MIINQPPYDPSWFPDPSGYDQFEGRTKLGNDPQFKPYKDEYLYRNNYLVKNFLNKLGIQAYCRRQTGSYWVFDRKTQALKEVPEYDYGEYVPATFCPKVRTFVSDKRNPRYLFERNRHGDKVCWYVQNITHSAELSRWHFVVEQQIRERCGLESKIPDYMNTRDLPDWAEEQVFNKRKYRNSDNFNGFRFYFLDLDKENSLNNVLSLVNELKLFPYLGAVVETSPNKHHLYFHVHNYDYDETLHRLLISTFDADPASTNKMILAQLPGYTNPKNGFEARVVHVNSKILHLPTDHFVDSLHSFLSQKKNCSIFNRIKQKVSDSDVQEFLEQIQIKKNHPRGRKPKFRTPSQVINHHQQLFRDKYPNKIKERELARLKIHLKDLKIDFTHRKDESPLFPAEEYSAYNKKIIQLQAKINQQTVEINQTCFKSPSQRKFSKKFLKKIPTWEEYRIYHSLQDKIPEKEIDISGRRNQALLGLCLYAHLYVDLFSKDQCDLWIDSVIIPYFKTRFSADLTRDSRSNYRTTRSQAHSLFRKTRRTWDSPSFSQAKRDPSPALPDPSLSSVNVEKKKEPLFHSFHFDSNVIVSRMISSLILKGVSQETIDWVRPTLEIIATQLSKVFFQKGKKPCYPAFYQTENFFIYSNFFVPSTVLRQTPGASDYNPRLQFLSNMNMLYRSPEFTPPFGDSFTEAGSRCRNFLLVIPKIPFRISQEKDLVSFSGNSNQEHLILLNQELNLVGKRDSFSPLPLFDQSRFFQDLTQKEKLDFAKRASHVFRFSPEDLIPILLHELKSDLPSKEQFKRFNLKKETFLHYKKDFTRLIPDWSQEEVGEGDLGPRAFLSQLFPKEDFTLELKELSLPENQGKGEKQESCQEEAGEKQEEWKQEEWKQEEWKQEEARSQALFSQQQAPERIFVSHKLQKPSSPISHFSLLSTHKKHMLHTGSSPPKPLLLH